MQSHVGHLFVHSLLEGTVFRAKNPHLWPPALFFYLGPRPSFILNAKLGYGYGLLEVTFGPLRGCAGAS